MCIAFHVFFKHRDILHAVRATWIENMSFNLTNFLAQAKRIDIFELAIEYGLVDQVEFRRINRCTDGTVFFVAHRLANL